MVQDTERESPHDVVLPCEGGETLAAALDLDQDLARGALVAQLPQRDPDGCIDLAGIERQLVARLDTPDVWRHGERRQPATRGSDGLEPAEVGADAAEVEPDLLEGLPARGFPEAGVIRVPASAGERDVSGPGVALMFRAANEKDVEIVAGAQQERDGGLELARRRRRRPIRLEGALHRTQTRIGGPGGQFVSHDAQSTDFARGRANAAAREEPGSPRRVSLYMLRLRKYGLRLGLLALPVLACSGGAGTGRVDAGGALERGEERASELIELARESSLVEGPEAIELLYLERLRLGLGSPFRLIEQALADERIEPERRRRLAEALLVLTHEARGYVIDPAGIAGPRGRSEPLVAAAHLRLATDAVAEASDPRTGEEAVRLAYLLAQAEGVVDPVLLRGVAHAASLVRDRELARRDARALVREAYATARDPLDLVGEWRSAHRFAVESPSLVTLSSEAEGQAIRLAQLLSGAIRDAEESAEQLTTYRRIAPASLLNAATASGLSRTLESMPPQAPVAVAVGLAGRMFAGSYGIEPDTLAAELRRRMPNEERLAVQQAVLLAHQPELRPLLARATLAAASGLRGYSQEVVWRPGMAAPSTRELVAQFGLADVAFASSVPAAWRPYYRRMLHSALLDLQRVLPALDVRGLRIVIGPVPSSNALALHNPGQRAIYLPPETGAGTIAHEIAHDLDWQVARKRYRVRGDYGSDLSARRGRLDHLAATYQGLTGAALTDNSGTPIDRPHHTRPAEIFARSIDWLVAASLARDGRVNGYLTSIQDELLTGYGTAVPPDVNGRVPAALMTILDEVAPMRAEHRSWYLDAYGLGREVAATDLLGIINDVPADGSDFLLPAASDSTSGLAAGSHALLSGSFTRLRQAADAAIAAGVCRVASSRLEPRGTGARTQLVEAATAARAHGLARVYAVRMMGPTGAPALAERFGPGPWATPVEPAQAGALLALVDAVNEVTAPRVAETERWRIGGAVWALPCS